MASKDSETAPVEVNSAKNGDLCTPCSEEGMDTKAICKCTECQSYFCQNCERLHNKILKTHTLLMIGKDTNHRSKADGLLARAPVLADTCNEHPAEVLKMFCGNHDLVCCTVCAAIYHRLCVGMQYIPITAKGINERQDRAETLKSLDDVRGDLQNLLSERKEDLSRLRVEKDEIINKMKEMTKRLVARIKELETLTAKQIDAGHKDIENDIKCDISSIDTVLNSVEQHLHQVRELEAENEVQLFIQVKLGSKLAAKSKKQLDEMINKKVRSIEYELNSNIEAYLKEVESLGNFSCENYANVASLIGEYSIILETEKTSQVSVYGVCLLKTNEIILADNSNLKLKRLDTEYQMVDWIDLGATPYGICRTAYSEVHVAVSFLCQLGAKWL